MNTLLFSTNALAEPSNITDRLAVGFYLAYAALAITLVLWLSRTLSRHGNVFLKNVFDSDELAAAVNHLLVVGFLLLNLGYALTLYKVQSSVNLSEAYNTLIARLGTLLASLGLIHLLNMALFWKIRLSRSSKTQTSQFPAPYSFVPPTFTPATQTTQAPQTATTAQTATLPVTPADQPAPPVRPTGPDTTTPPPPPIR